MNEPTLLLPAPSAPAVSGQALLFSPEIEKLVEQEETATGVYTAERFKVRRPDDYQAVIQLLGRNKGMMAIAKLLGCHHKTVAAVRDLEPEAIDTVRSKRVTKILTAVDLQIERLIESPGLVPMNVAGLLISQLVDKAELLEGRATQRVEKVERIDIYAQWDEVLEKHLDPAAVREIDERAGIGLGTGNKSPIEGGALEDPARPGELLDADIDAESAVSGTITPERSIDDPALTTTDLPDEGAGAGTPDVRRDPEEGAGGSVSSRGDGPTQSGYEKQNFSANRPLPTPPI